jgi:hypothetical protein
MPTPFMHLQVAEQIRQDDGLSADLQVRISKYMPAFYLGHIAPDVQSISGAARAETHFYDLPPRVGHEAHLEMMARYPELARASALGLEHAVFIAAYCAHLMLDLRWYREVLIPFFVQPADWGDLRQRFLVHNILLTFLDQLAVESLPKSARETLVSSNSDHWLPFVKDADLHLWRDKLVEQLPPGGSLLTTRIYAARLSMSPAEFAAHLHEPAWMEEQVFGKVPVDFIEAMLTSAVAESVELISDYMKLS